MIFEEIYEKYFSSIVFLCQKFCDSKEDAEEVAQETFVIAFKKLDHIKPETILAYLRKIAIHESYRKRNASNNRKIIIAGSDELLANHIELDEDFLPEEALKNKEKRAELMKAIDSLPKMQCKMIYMYYFADLNVQEIADLLKCSAHNVRQTLYVAKRTLKGKLEKEFGGKAFKGFVFVSIGALLSMEEQIFAENYAGASGTNTAAAAKSTNFYLIGACTVALGVAIATFLYFILPSTGEDYYVYGPYNLNYEASLDADTPKLIIEKPEDAGELKVDNTTSDLQSTQVPTPESEAAAGIAQMIPSQPIMEEERSIEKPKQEEEEKQVLEEEVEVKPKDEIESPPHPHMDRTPEILEALAFSTSDADVGNIIAYFDFTPALQIRLFTDEIIRAYVTNEGSGDILIGISSHEDGSGWYMRFKHFSNEQAPLDVRSLLSFME